MRVELRDYREVRGQYDAVVSVEMIEAVGADYWSAYFSMLDRALAPGSRVGPHDREQGRLHLDPRVRLPRRAHPVEEAVRDHTRLGIVET